MPELTQQDHADRATRIYASDLEAVLCGADRFGRTAADVWARLTGKLQPASGDEASNEAMELGHTLEPVILDWIETQTGPIERKPALLHYRHPTLPLGAHLDGQVIESGCPAEAKTAGQAGPTPTEWIEAVETGAAPERVVLQVHAQMLCSGAGMAFIGALVGGRGRFLFRVPLQPDLADLVASGVQQFWDLYVRTDTRPPDSSFSLDVLRRFRRQPGKIVIVSDAAFHGWDAARENRLRCEKEEDAAKADLLSALWDAEIGIAEDLSGAVAYQAQTRNAFDLAAFRAAHPDLAQEFMRARSFPKLGTPLKPTGKRFREIAETYQARIAQTERKGIENDGS